MKFLTYFFMFFFALNLHAQTNTSPVISAGQKAKDERLGILLNEQKEEIQNLKAVTEREPKNEKKIKQINENLRALNVEIERVKKEKPIEIIFKKPVVQAASSSEISSEKPPETKKFESWDVFKNFGKKEVKNEGN